jgi:hypothetical protein
MRVHRHVDRGNESGGEVLYYAAGLPSFLVLESDGHYLGTHEPFEPGIYQRTKQRKKYLLLIFPWEFLALIFSNASWDRVAGKYGNRSRRVGPGQRKPKEIGIAMIPRFLDDVQFV